ncbi:sirohydrochlorin chelatase [Luethyella okanaganae]|uniref:Sirohydrochlorin chelatase n=1 Tax=Luethyella okanaganae TaxID=69372 RepID=A0ABW1VDM9_9MICO
MNTTLPALVGISHGTSSPAGQAAVAGLMRAVSHNRPDLHTALGHVDVQLPDVTQVLAELTPGRSAIVVPLLLSAGFHVHVDLGRAVRAEPSRRVALADALGPDDRLVDVLRYRLTQAGATDDDTLVLAAAGSSDARAVADCRAVAERLTEASGRVVTLGFLSAAKPRLEAAIAAARTEHPDSRVVASSYLLAPGYFQALAEKAGADVTTAPLLVDTEPVPPGLVELVLDRYLTAANRSF